MLLKRQNNQIKNRHSDIKTSFNSDRELADNDGVFVANRFQLKIVFDVQLMRNADGTLSPTPERVPRLAVSLSFNQRFNSKMSH